MFQQQQTAQTFATDFRDKIELYFFYKAMWHNCDDSTDILHNVWILFIMNHF